MTAADEFLEDLLAGEEQEEAEIAELLAEARSWVFGESGIALSLDKTLAEVWEEWGGFTDRADAWALGHAKALAALRAERKTLPKGKAGAEARAALEERRADLAWRTNAARFVLYEDYPDQQAAMLELLRGAWEESGVDEEELDGRMDEFGGILAERRALQLFHDRTLREIAVTVVAARMRV